MIKELVNRHDLWAIGVHLSELKREIRIFSADDVAQLVQVLAMRMQAELSADVLSQMRVVPIPRGGLFVAGQLTYALNLSRDQFADDGVSPVCMVDDCALTGKRFDEMMRRFDGREVIFCHLASSAPLRQAILQQEAGVRQVIAAADLAIRQNDVGEPFGDERRYWNGSVFPVAFPWTEPGLPVAFGESVVDGWRLLPPHCTLGNLAGLDLPVLTADSADVEVPPTVIWRLVNDKALLYEESGRKLFELSGMAAVVWKRCAGYRSQDLALRDLPSDQRAAGKKLIDELLAKRLLVRL